MSFSYPISNSTASWRGAGMPQALQSGRGEAERVSPLPPERVPAVLDVPTAEQLEQRLSRIRQDSSPHGSRALAAYQALAAGEERDNVSALLGINVYA